MMAGSPAGRCLPRLDSLTSYKCLRQSLARVGSRRSLWILAAAWLGALGIAEFTARPERRAAAGVAFAPEGDRVAAVSFGENHGGGLLHVWDVATGREVASISLLDRPLSLAFAPGGAGVAIGGWDGTVNLWEPSSGRLLRSFSGHGLPVRGLAFTPDGRSLAAGASDGVVILWDAMTGDERSRWNRGRDAPVNSLTISRDGRFLAASGGLGPGATSLWDVRTGKSSKRTALVGAQDPLAFAPTRGILAARVSGRSGSVQLTDLDKNQVLCTLASRSVRSLACSPDGLLLATGGDDESVCVWGIADGRCVASFGGHEHSTDYVGDHVRELMAPVGLAERRVQNVVWSVAFSPDGKRLASAGQDGSVWLWDLPRPQRENLAGRPLLPRPSSANWLTTVRIGLAFGFLVLFALAARNAQARTWLGLPLSRFSKRGAMTQLASTLRERSVKTPTGEP